MKVRAGPRPWSITSFAGILGIVACWNLGVDVQRALAEPDEAARVALVSAASARFLIPIIPAAFIWLFASRIARWFVTIASVGFAIVRTATAMHSGLPDTETLMRFSIGLAMNALVLLLFTPAARRWFAADPANDASFRK